jgi:hypothetical protein
VQLQRGTWASGGSLNTARTGCGGAGLQTAAVAAGGSTGSTVAIQNLIMEQVGQR